MTAYSRIFAAALAAAASLGAAPPLLAQATQHSASVQSSADIALEKRVRTALGATLGKPADEIGVAAYNGNVMLYGAVRSRYARASAEATASRVPGVHSVANTLTIVRGT